MLRLVLCSLSFQCPSLPLKLVGVRLYGTLRIQSERRVGYSDFCLQGERARHLCQLWGRLARMSVWCRTSIEREHGYPFNAPATF